jgi:hypothetical protein
MTNIGHDLIAHHSYGGRDNDHFSPPELRDQVRGVTNQNVRIIDGSGLAVGIATAVSAAKLEMLMEIAKFAAQEVIAPRMRSATANPETMTMRSSGAVCVVRRGASWLG